MENLVNSEVRVYIIKRLDDDTSDNSRQWRDSTKILKEHCYSRPHNQLCDSRFMQPTKKLFVTNKWSALCQSSNSSVLEKFNNDNEIDVVTLPEDQPLIYNQIKALSAMEQCEHYAMSGRVIKNEDGGPTSWEDKIDR